VVLGSEHAREKPGVLLRDSSDLVVVPQSGRLIAALGVSGLIVVDTDDVVMICPRSRAQEVKSLVDTLRAEGELGYV
jgi:mannose-1-phosphate guanylyltransferase